jgi:hypothetical protein
LNVAATLREEANVLRKWGASPIADVIDRCPERYEEALREYQKQLVSLAEARPYSRDTPRTTSDAWLAPAGDLMITLMQLRRRLVLHGPLRS